VAVHWAKAGGKAVTKITTKAKVGSAAFIIGSLLGFECGRHGLLLGSLTIEVSAGRKAELPAKKCLSLNACRDLRSRTRESLGGTEPC
jgi:hypothetical protein